MALILTFFPLAFVLFVVLLIRSLFFRQSMSKFEKQLLVILGVIAALGLLFSIMFSIGFN